MTVKDLIKMLKNCPQDSHILIKDSADQAFGVDRIETSTPTANDGKTTVYLVAPQK